MINNSPERPLPIKVRHVRWTRENYEWICRYGVEKKSSKLKGGTVSDNPFFSDESPCSSNDGKKFIFLIHCLASAQQHGKHELLMQFFFSTVRFIADPLSCTIIQGMQSTRKTLFSVHWIVIIFFLCSWVVSLFFARIIMHFMLAVFGWHNKQL
jgi:hypothetical protein